MPNGSSATKSPYLRGEVETTACDERERGFYLPSLALGQAPDSNVNQLALTYDVFRRLQIKVERKHEIGR